MMFHATESATNAAGLNLDALGLSVDNVLTIGMIVTVMSVFWVWRVTSLPKVGCSFFLDFHVVEYCWKRERERIDADGDDDIEERNLSRIGRSQEVSA